MRAFFMACAKRGFIMTTPHPSITPNHRKPNDIIKKELKKQGLSQVRVAFDLGLHRSDFCLIANGYLVPKPETRSKIATYLGISEKQLFGEGV